MGLSWANLASQNRSTCFGTSSSSATSLIVRKASGALSNAPPPRRQTPRALFGRLSSRERIIDTLLHDVACAEHEHATRRDGNFLARLWVASNALTLVATPERAERRKLHRVPTLEARHDLAKHELYDLGGLVPRQTNLLKHRLRQVGARECLPAHLADAPPVAGLIKMLTERVRGGQSVTRSNS